MRQVDNDKRLDIATGINRTTKVWKNTQITWSELVDKLSQTTTTPETVAEYRAMPKSQQAELKDVGGFVGGYLDDGSRKKVRHRSILCLDADFATPELWDDWEMLFGNAAVAYTTHKHTPEKPRFRLVIPLSRNANLDEYTAVGRKVAHDLGMDQFDDTSYEPGRMMYYPSTSKDGEYVFEFCDGPFLDVDAILASYTNWQDVSSWPISSREATATRKSVASEQADPLTKDGLVGAFCRAYTIEDAIEKFVPVYEPCGDGRYTYTDGSTAGGVVTYDHKFSYSHHGTDPATGRLLNAWDLVRVQKFGELDADEYPGTRVTSLPSTKAMKQLVKDDVEVTRQLYSTAENFADDFADDETTADEQGPKPGWEALLQKDDNGNLKQLIYNVYLILENDPRLAGCIALDRFTGFIVIRRDLPWRKLEPVDCWPRNAEDLSVWEKKDRKFDMWTDSDDAQLRMWLQMNYRGFSGTKVIEDAVNNYAEDHAFHPILEYLNDCKWDGVHRIDSFLIDYLGAEDTEYVRTVTRKWFVAAVARVARPGIKYDYLLTIHGAQGKGKSSIFAKLGGRWFSDSFHVFTGKESYEQARNTWVGEIGELAGMRKSEVNDVKAYLSKTEDLYRPAYGHRIQPYPRQCVFVGTTNDLTFLRDETGNRRFWVVTTPNEPRLDQWKDLTPDGVKLLWAEAVALYKGGEKLTLDKNTEAEAARIADAYMEENPDVGIVQEYLDRLLPSDWDSKSLIERRMWLDDKNNVGTVQRTVVTTREVWTEALCQDPKRLDRQNVNNTRSILARIPGWEYQGDKRISDNVHGRQRYYERKE